MHYLPFITQFPSPLSFQWPRLNDDVIGYNYAFPFFFVIINIYVSGGRDCNILKILIMATKWTTLTLEYEAWNSTSLWSKQHVKKQNRKVVQINAIIIYNTEENTVYTKSKKTNTVPFFMSTYWWNSFQDLSLTVKNMTWDLCYKC